MSNRDFIRVNRQRPCAICSGPDWCGVSADGAVAICMRKESEKRSRNGGYVHRLRDPDDFQPRRFIRRITLATTPTAEVDFVELTDRYSRAVTDAALASLARSLGVSPAALRRLRVGYDGDAWTFPMTDPSDRIVGIRRRLPNGRKLSVKGGAEGLFVPVDLPETGTLYICEGATDTAALLTLGFAAIGRPCCTGGVAFIVQVCRRRDAVIFGDADAPGQAGASTLAQRLRLHCPSVRIIQPPEGINDAREWVRRGATAADIERAAEHSEPITISIRTMIA